MITADTHVRTSHDQDRSSAAFCGGTTETPPPGGAFAVFGLTMVTAGRAARGPAQCPAGHVRGRKGTARTPVHPDQCAAARPGSGSGRRTAAVSRHPSGARRSPRADDTLTVTSNATSAPPLPGRRGNELQLLHGLLLRHAPEAFDRVIEATLVEDLETAVAAMAEGIAAVGEQILDDDDRAALSVVRAAFLVEAPRANVA